MSSSQQRGTKRRASTQAASSIAASSSRRKSPTKANTGKKEGDDVQPMEIDTPVETGPVLPPLAREPFDAVAFMSGGKGGASTVKTSLNPKSLLAGYYGPRGERVRHVVHEGCLRLPLSALEMIQPDETEQESPSKDGTTKKKKDPYELPGLDFIVRPSMDKERTSITVTEVYGVKVTAPPPPPPAPRMIPGPPGQPPIYVPAPPADNKPTTTIRSMARNRTIALPIKLSSPAPGTGLGDAERIRGGGDEGETPSEDTSKQAPAPSPEAAVAVPTPADATSTSAASASQDPTDAKPTPGPSSAEEMPSEPTQPAEPKSADPTPPVEGEKTAETEEKSTESTPPAEEKATAPVAPVEKESSEPTPPTEEMTTEPTAPAEEKSIETSEPSEPKPAESTPAVESKPSESSQPSESKPVAPMNIEPKPAVPMNIEPKPGAPVPPTEPKPTESSQGASAQPSQPSQPTIPTQTTTQSAATKPPPAEMAMRLKSLYSSKPPDNPTAPGGSLQPLAPKPAVGITTSSVATPAPVSNVSTGPPAAPASAPIAATASMTAPAALSGPVPSSTPSSATASGAAASVASGASTSQPVAALKPAQPQVVTLQKTPAPQWEQHIPGPNDEMQVDPANKTPKPDWYDPKGISELEKTLLTEWFDGSASHRTPETYIAARERMIEMSDKLSNRYVTGTMVRRAIPGDVGSLLRLHSFLTTHSIINDDAINDSAPTPVALQEDKTKFRWSMSMRDKLLQAVIEISRKRRKVEEGSSGSDGSASFDWDAVAATLGHGVSGRDCERQFLAMPIEADSAAIKESSVSASGTTERPITPEPSGEQAQKTAALTKEEMAKKRFSIQNEIFEELVESSDPKVVAAVTDVAIRAAEADSTASLEQAKKAGLVGLVASQAVEEARSHEDAVANLLAEVVELRMKKLENRLLLLDDVEGMLEAERVALELERRDLYTARCRHWFGGP